MGRAYRHADQRPTFTCHWSRSWRPQARKDGAIPQPRRWRIKSLRLRGAIGVWKGRGIDDLGIDFDDFEAGLIALTGPNGAGKTTVLENLTPWPAMLTRSGPLQQHFRLRDSFRELVIVDDESDDAVPLPDSDRRRDGQARSKGLLRDGGSTTAENAGRGGRGRRRQTAEYERVVDELWGPRPLHMLSVVSPQRPVSLRVRGDDGEAITITTDLAAASRGMRRALLRQLLGLGAYQAASRSAMGQSIHRNDEAAGKEADASRYELDAAELSRTAATFDEAFDAHKDALAGHERADRELENADAAGVRATEKARESRAARERSQALTGQIDDAQRRIVAIDEELGGYEWSASTRDEAAEVLADWEAASAALIGERELHDEAMAEWSNLRSYAESQLREAEAAHRKMDNELLRLIESRARRIKEHESSCRCEMEHALPGVRAEDARRSAARKWRQQAPTCMHEEIDAQGEPDPQLDAHGRTGATAGAELRIAHAGAAAAERGPDHAATAGARAQPGPHAGAGNHPHRRRGRRQVLRTQG